MSLGKVIEDFEEAVEDLEAGTLSGRTRFKDLKSWDSLAVLTLTDAIEMEYGVLLNKRLLDDVETVEGLYAYVVENKQSSL